VSQTTSKTLERSGSFRTNIYPIFSLILANALEAASYTPKETLGFQTLGAIIVSKP
jgi:hypothetical protein